MGFKDYKIRDGVHIPSKKYKEGWNAIFGKKGSVLNTEESFKSKEYKEFKPEGENSEKSSILNKKQSMD
ncbi:hypothetical protein HQ621_28165 [Pseudomonas simiae]|uniref:hypothetical protein n=1 Tax=Pseudomonas simiae TaxID=321846 RepID=UPI00116238FE|nr:hypothetical protein [Pseudomonas simiae]AXH68320.1 hypothetical protein P021_gp11 [Pelagibacter phage HTVC021P]NVH64783.1 hypothetical protein [Pseudomonas simiae]